MADFIMFKDFLSYTIDSKSSEQTNWPVSNIQTPEKPFRYWKTSDTNQAWVILDFGAAKAVNAVVLINVNYSTVKIQGDTTNAFTTPPVDSGNITISKDDFTGRYKLIKDPQTFTPAFNHRFMRILIPAQATTDGDSVFKTGGIIVSTSSETLLRQPSWGMQIAVDRSKDSEIARSGSLEVVNLGERFVQIGFDIQSDRQAANLTQVGKLLATIDESTLIVFAFNGNLVERTDNSQFVYVCRRVGGFSYRIQSFPHAMIEGITLREQI